MMGQPPRLLSLRVLGPDAQVLVDGIVFIDPAVAILVVGGQFGEAVARRGAKQFATVVDRAVAVAVPLGLVRLCF